MGDALRLSGRRIVYSTLGSIVKFCKFPLSGKRGSHHRSDFQPVYACCAQMERDLKHLVELGFSTPLRPRQVGLYRGPFSAGLVDEQRRISNSRCPHAAMHSLHLLQSSHFASLSTRYSQMRFTSACLAKTMMRCDHLQKYFGHHIFNP
jgi:hypothetical protein